MVSLSKPLVPADGAGRLQEQPFGGRHHPDFLPITREITAAMSCIDNDCGSVGRRCCP